jgi:hypothetical protein
MEIILDLQKTIKKSKNPSKDVWSKRYSYSHASSLQMMKNILIFLVTGHTLIHQMMIQKKE